MKITPWIYSSDIIVCLHPLPASHLAPPGPRPSPVTHSKPVLKFDWQLDDSFNSENLEFWLSVNLGPFNQMMNELCVFILLTFWQAHTRNVLETPGLLLFLEQACRWLKWSLWLTWCTVLVIPAIGQNGAEPEDRMWRKGVVYLMRQGERIPAWKMWSSALHRNIR